MIRKAVLCIMILTLIAPILSGCWNRRELNDLAIVAALAVDRLGSKYLVTAQVVDPGEVAAGQGGGGRSPVTTYHSTGNTIFEAIRKMTTVTPRKLYFSHLRIFVIGEQLARQGMGEVLDLLSRDQEGRTDFYLLIAKGDTAQNIMNVLTPMEKIPATKIYSSLEVSEKAWAPTVSVQLDELITSMVSPGIQPALTGVVIHGSKEKGKKKENMESPETPAHLQFRGIAIFREDKLVAWMNEYESKGFSYITDRLDSTVVEAACPNGGRIGIEIIRSNTKIKAKVKRGKPEAEVVMFAEANVADVECKIELTKTGTLQILERETEKEMQRQAELSIRKAQKFKSDVFGFGEAVHRGAPAYWNKTKERWDDEFSHLKVTFHIDVKIRRIGTLGESFLNDIKE